MSDATTSGGARPHAGLPAPRRSGGGDRLRLHRRCCSLVGSLYSPSFLSPEYLLQQLKVASFLGVIATGMMLVILLGQIDLSVPWVVAVGGDDGLRGRRLRPGRRGAGDPVRHRSAAWRSAWSTASASPICASPR